MPAKDGTYILDLCDRILNLKAKRGHRFDFLKGDPNEKGRCALLPVDAYYPELQLVIEYQERQHTEAVPIMDRRMTVSGMLRGEQRRRYDLRRHEVLPLHGITLLELSYSDFAHDSSKRLRRTAADEGIIRQKLAQFSK